MVKQGGVATYSQITNVLLGVQGAKDDGLQSSKAKSKPADTPIEYMKHGTPILNIKQARKLNLQIPLNLKGCRNERRGLQMNLIVSSIGQGLLWALLGLGLYLTF